MPNVPSLKCPKVYDALRRDGYDKETSARISNAMARRGKCGGKRKEMSAQTEKHGRHNQRTHANRYGGQSMGKLKSHFKTLSKEERTKFKAEARRRRDGARDRGNTTAADLDRLQGGRLRKGDYVADRQMGWAQGEVVGSAALGSKRKPMRVAEVRRPDGKEFFISLDNIQPLGFGDVDFPTTFTLED